MVKKRGWAVVAPDGTPRWWAPTKKQFLDAPTTLKAAKQVWRKDKLWEVEIYNPQVYRDTWPKYYKRGWRFKRATQTITLEER